MLWHKMVYIHMKHGAVLKMSNVMLSVSAVMQLSFKCHIFTDHIGLHFWHQKFNTT